MTTPNSNSNRVLLLNKPFRVLCQFSEHEGKRTLAEFISTPDIYPAGRLDFDSEGLLLLTGDGQLQHHLTDPDHKLPKTYWVQVEGQVSEHALRQLENGVELKDGKTRPATAILIPEPEGLWERNPPVRFRANIPTSWIELTISEGKNRQVRRMTAAVGFPTLRLIRSKIGPWELQNLSPGECRWETIPHAILTTLKKNKELRSHKPRKHSLKKPYHRSRAR